MQCSHFLLHLLVDGVYEGHTVIVDGGVALLLT